MQQGMPRFLDIEFYQTDDLFFPTAMAWSLSDGRMKTVVIEPDESWLPEDADLDEEELLYLREQGVPLIELARALHEDLPDQQVFTDGLDPDETLVDLIFDAVGMDVPFELAPLEDLIPGMDRDTLEDHRRELMFEQGLEPQLPENGVYALLLLAQREGLMEPPEHGPEDADNDLE
ncbi:hypothetical protein SAMN05216203_0114 [Marinobacter daqiaonensis]|uniref:Uncharacterized protein n=1 Tax=Marinobacter daqiaonensis TaxID=650891 RepID=A0A1I6GHU4_9GAMM|nr:hypothetical protein [Marinobacter daqiaonensis]SFR41744.1 hypothetical protein SAMN05216203_0114 [Marinobacter daqiaonensis]